MSLLGCRLLRGERMKYNKLDETVLALLQNALDEGLSVRAIARDVLGKESRESSIRGALSRGKLKVKTGEEAQTIESQKWDTVPSKIFNSNPKVEPVRIATSKYVSSNITQVMIPDTQCKGGITLDYLHNVGMYLADKQPEVIVHIGDHADFPSLSSYDKGKKSAEGKRLYEDINAAIEGMNVLLQPIKDLQQRELEQYGEIRYKPKMVLTLGNHEQRLERHLDANPELHGLLSYSDLRYEDMGWEVYDYLEPAIINGVAYCHFFANPMTGKPYGGTALNILKQVGVSFCMGHKQVLDVATRFLPTTGKQQWAIIAGACYDHMESYKGIQGNHHWRGIVVKHNVMEGSFNPLFIDLEYLEGRYGNLT